MGGFSAPVVCIVAAASLVVNAIVYSLLICAPSHWFQRTVEPMSVERRIQKQMLRFSLIAVFTWLPFWVVALTGRSPALFWAKDWCGLASALPMSLNGALNVWAYASHNRHLRQVRAHAQAVGELEGSQSNESFAVGFRSYVDVCDIPARPSSYSTGTPTGSSMDSEMSLDGCEASFPRFDKTPVTLQ